MKATRHWGIALLMTALIVLAVVIAALGSRNSQPITPNDEFFTLSISTPPQVDIVTWRLEVTGMVDHPVNLSYAEITSLANVTEIASLRCVTGPSGTAYWTGVTLPQFMQMMGLNSSATELVFFSADGYSTSLTVDELNRSDVLLAWGMNNVTLPVDQGYPLKLVVPGDWGYKWAKWVTKVVAVDYDYKGFWESRGWADDASINPITDWQVHAVLLSFAAVFGGFAAISGLRNSTTTNLAERTPELFPRRLHRYISGAYYLILFGTFIYWALSTYDYRGAVFYSFHGRIALLTILFSLVGIATGVPLLSGSKRYRVMHFVFNMAGYALLLITIVLGIIRAAG